MPRPRRLYDDLDASPGDDSRCRRSDGRKWRCHKRAMDGLVFCEYHYIQTRANIEKHKASARKSNRSAAAPPSRKRAKQAERSAESIAPKRRVKLEEESGEAEAGTTRVLPNGLMTIATTPPVGGCRDEGGFVDRKVGFEEGRLLTRRCIRSKNAEAIPVATIKKIPCGRGSGMGRKMACHSCKEKNVVNMVRCLSCRKRFFCSCCIEKRYSGMLEKEVKISCPVCCGCCDCEACSASPAKYGCKDFEIVQKKTKHANNDEISLVEVKTLYSICHGQLDYTSCPPLGAKEDRHKACRKLTNGQDNNCKEHAYNLISELFPLLKHIYLNQLNELEIKKRDQEGEFSGVLLQVDEPDNELFNCNYCRTSLADFHRSCSKCSYKLCFGCCGNILQGSFSQAPAIDSSKAGRRERAKKYVISVLVGKRKRLCVGEQPDSSSLSTIESDTKVTHWRSISCPPKESGGCGKGLLKLRCNLPFRRSNDPTRTVEEVAFSSDHPHSILTHPHAASSLLDNQKIGHFSISLLEPQTGETFHDSFQQSVEIARHWHKDIRKFL